MRVVIIGGGGMIGQKLARALGQRGEIGAAGG
jgi:nucleoside-diphosphate-sugar epimerase